MIILPNHNRDEAAAFAERVRADTENRSFSVRSEEVLITISVGVAVYPRDGATYAEVLVAANRAEHQAKSAGRNRVVLTLHEHEKGYEHLPEVQGEDIHIAQQNLESFGEDTFETEAGLNAFEALNRLVEQKQAAQFTNLFLPTLPTEIKNKRATLIAEIVQLLSRCRACKDWDDNSEYKLSRWLDHVPQNMIPYTSIPNLLRIRSNVERFLALHTNI